MHSDRTPTDLNPVQDKVVVLAAYLGGVTAIEWKESHTNSGATSERIMAVTMRAYTLTSEKRPSYSAWTSCHAGAVKGWCVLLHLPFAKASFSASARVNKGNSVIQRKCGVRVGV